MHEQPNMIGNYHLVAIAKNGDGLYEWRNWRMGGRMYKYRSPDGTERDWTAYGTLGRVHPKAPRDGGRWKWLEPR